MKVLIPILIGLLFVGCEKKQTNNTDKGNNTPENSAKKEVKETPSKGEDKSSAGTKLVSDSIFPLIELPRDYEARRSTTRKKLPAGQSVELLDVKGPGAVRHFWITSRKSEDLEIEITVDGARTPQVKMTLHRFFGILLGKKPYEVNSAALKVLLKNGFNCYFPIPFQTSCLIVLRNYTKKMNYAIYSMVDWQKYHDDTQLTSLRLHAQYTEQKPAERFDSSLIGAIGGKGFVAGLFHATKRHDMSDVIWHTGGDTWLIDGETSPHVLRGIGNEDIFGYSYGVYLDANDWTGGVHLVGEGPDTSEVVCYRIFGVDAIPFKSSIVVRMGARANDVEHVLYYYKESHSRAPEVNSPRAWTLSVPADVKNFESFNSAELPVDLGKSGTWGGRDLKPLNIEPEHTWVDFARYFRRNQVSNPGTQPSKCAAYAHTTIRSSKQQKVTVRL